MQKNSNGNFQGRVQREFKGFIVLDCVIRSRDLSYFTLCEDYTQWPFWTGGEGPTEDRLAKRVVVFMRDEPKGERWNSEGFQGMHIFNTGVSYFPEEKFASVTFDGGAVYVLGGGVDELEQPIPRWIDGGFRRGAITRCRTIDGYMYIAGDGRTVAMRRGRNEWKALNKELPFVYAKDWECAGFNDIDGFGANDIYCVGSKGDVWHFNGSV